jgi:hypothetical protein
LSPGKVSWRYERGQRTEGRYSTDVATGQASFEPTPVDKTICSRPTFTPIRADNFMWDPLATGMHNASFVLYRSYQTLAHLRQMQDAGVYRNVDLVDVNRRVSSNLVGIDRPRVQAGDERHRRSRRVLDVRTAHHGREPRRRAAGRSEPVLARRAPVHRRRHDPRALHADGISEVETIIDLAKALTRA